MPSSSCGNKCNDIFWRWQPRQIRILSPSSVPLFCRQESTLLNEQLDREVSDRNTLLEAEQDRKASGRNTLFDGKQNLVRQKYPPWRRTEQRYVRQKYPPWKRAGQRDVKHRNTLLDGELDREVWGREIPSLKESRTEICQAQKYSPWWRAEQQGVRIDSRTETCQTPCQTPFSELFGFSFNLPV